MTDRRVGKRQDRPPGLAPSGTAWGFGVMMLYWEAIPAFTLLALTPFAADFMALFIAALSCTVLSLFVLIPVIIGFKGRRYWGVVAYFCCGAIAAAMPPIALLTIGTALLLSIGHPPALIGLTFCFALPILIMAALWPRLLRALRLKYWQPWTEPREWESGDERTPGWFARVASGPRV